MERLVKVQNIYATDDYQKFILDLRYNRPKKKNAKYKNLLKSIEKKGQTTPIIVKHYNDKYLIADGQHRVEILKELGLPIMFLINDDLNMPSLIDDTSKVINYEAIDFISMAANREIPIFMLMYRLVLVENNRLNMSSIIEIIFTYLVNMKQNIFSNNTFIKDCKADYDQAFKKYDKPITDDVLKEMYEFIKLIDELAEILDMKKVKVNLVKEALAYHLKYKNNDVALESIINFLKVEKPSRFSHQVQIKNSSKNQEFKEIFREIALKLSVEKY